MATYEDLIGLANDPDLQPKVNAAVVIAAYDLVKTGQTPTAAEQAWAAAVANEPENEGRKALRFILAANKGASVAQIQGATDAAIQTNVDEIVPALVAALAGA